MFICCDDSRDYSNNMIMNDNFIPALYKNYLEAYIDIKIISNKKSEIIYTI